MRNVFRFLWAKWIKKRCPHICVCCRFRAECRSVGYDDWGIV